MSVLGVCSSSEGSPLELGRKECTETDSPAICPSGRAVAGALLIGIVGQDGTVGINPQAFKIDDAFLREAEPHGNPERRFRFANRCVQGACGQWSNQRCGVIDEAVVLGRNSQRVVPLDCPIRPACRWYRQSGDEACRVCPLIVTNSLQASVPFPNLPDSWTRLLSLE